MATLTRPCPHCGHKLPMAADRCTRCGGEMPKALGRTMFGGYQAPALAERMGSGKAAVAAPGFPDDDDDATIIDPGPPGSHQGFEPIPRPASPAQPLRSGPSQPQRLPPLRPPQGAQPHAHPPQPQQPPQPGFQPQPPHAHPQHPPQPGFQPPPPHAHPQHPPQPDFQPQPPHAHPQHPPQPGFQPQPPHPQPMPGPAGIDPLFARDVFLLRQKMIALSDKYHVSDEHGRPIIYVERPAHVLRNLLAAFAAIGVFFGTFMIALLLGDAIGGGVGVAIMLVGIVLCVPAMLVVLALLAAKRHIGFFRDPSKSQPLLHISQDKKLELWRFTYTVRDPGGAHLATFYKNRIFDIFRRRWTWFAPNGEIVCVAKEDSILRAMLRRMLGALGHLLFRTNFVFLYKDSDHQIGMFNRTATILDRYALDLRADYAQTLDRRVALGLGVILDTAERR